MAKTSKTAPHSRYTRQTATRAPQGAPPPAPRVEADKPDTPAQQNGVLATLAERASQQVLAVTYWFDPSRARNPTR